MQPPVHPMRFPTLYMYLLRLPNGIQSHPQVKTLADVALLVRGRWPELPNHPDLPPDLRAALSAPWQKGEWVQETVFMALTALVRDIIYKDDEKYLQFCYDTSKEAYAGPVMRRLMHLVSPSLVVIGASKRWESFKQGTTFRTKNGKQESTTVVLTYPDHLYVRCMLEGFGKSLHAAIDCTKVSETSVQARIISPTECHYSIAWKFNVL